MKLKCPFCGGLTTQIKCTNCGFDISCDIINLATLYSPTESDRIKYENQRFGADNKLLHRTVEENSAKLESLQTAITGLGTENLRLILDNKLLHDLVEQSSVKPEVIQASFTKLKLQNHILSEDNRILRNAVDELSVKLDGHIKKSQNELYRLQQEFNLKLLAYQKKEKETISDSPKQSINNNSATADNQANKNEAVVYADINYKRKPGDIITFGTYRQSGQPGAKKEPIEWIVLSALPDKLLVISRYALDKVSFHIARKNVNWPNCGLRSWLNSTFINYAFSDKEKERIVPTVSANTLDKVFLLSVDEAVKYYNSDVFKADKFRACKATDYASHNGAYVSDNGNCWWWLRFNGESGNNNAAYVRHDGYISRMGEFVDSDKCCVRPAMWIKI